MDATTPPDALSRSYEILPEHLQHLMPSMTAQLATPSTFTGIGGLGTQPFQVGDLTRSNDHARGVRILSTAELLSLPPPEWLIEGVLRKGELGVIYGQPGSGKTFVALDIALCVATGTDWSRHSVKQGPVLYIAAEGLSGLGLRVQAWDPDCIPNPDAAPWTNFAVVGDAIQFLEDQFHAFLATLVARPAQPVLVVVDTLARCTVGADENSAKDMGLFVAACDRLRNQTGATVLVVHHTGKNGQSERGSSALRGAADTMIEVKESEQADAQVIVRCDKQKEAAPFEEMIFELRTVTISLGGFGPPVTSCKLSLPATETSTPKSHTDLRPAELAICRALRDCFLHDGACNSNLQRVSGVAYSTFQKALTKLVERGYVARGERHGSPHYRITPKFEVEAVSAVSTGLSKSPATSVLSLSSPPPCKGGETETDSGTEQRGG